MSVNLPVRIVNLHGQIVILPVQIVKLPVNIVILPTIACKITSKNLGIFTILFFCNFTRSKTHNLAAFILP